MASKRGAGSGKRKESRGKVLLKRAALAVVGVWVAWFAIQGGEFGTWDLIKQRREITRTQHQIDSLSKLVASLQAYYDSVEHDPFTQERIAREEFGMVRDKELLYRFVDSIPRPAPERP